MNYDVIIVGGGPAGFTAGIYVARAMYKAIIVEKSVPGGQVAISDIVDNYTGFIEITGSELSQKMLEHVMKFDVPIEYSEVVEIWKEDKTFYVKLIDDRILTSKALIVATGASPRKLNVKGEAEFYGRGVSYCAVCDGAFFKNKVVAVVGGGDSAFTEGLYLSNIVSKLYLIHRREQFRAQPIYVERLKQRQNTEFILNSVVKEIIGEKKVSDIILENLKTGEISSLRVDGIFIYIGMVPQNQILRNFKELKYDENGFVIADETTRTEIEGLFVAGDLRSKHLRQITTAVSDGAYAGTMAVEYIQNNF
ncbi:MAG: thioredoxin-disulfide reductase [candidate division WOR-3 bacterium]|nr:thioredoxin-disulfide reductase [candidate division WOR-3 bacterium]MCX7947115.1 thioredoxin-disulfide reductase [candidate division WOR-3 bacterium]MDW8149844.1 thioredoxin-disulfide reductase [candidate division WOR-3 bacterium]